VVGELLGGGDLIVFDALCHNSILLGTKLSAATRKSFPHNDMAALDRLLTECRHNYERVLIVVEGLYSMDGDVARLPELVEIKKRHDAWLMVDEAHALGVLGKTGRGVFEHFGTPPSDVDIWMGTLSKALSGCGGYIAGSHQLIEILKFHASAFMFSVGMSPPVAAASLAALTKMRREPERVAALQQNGARFIEECRKLGLDSGLSAGFAVGVVLIGDSLRTAKLAERLFDRGINTIPVTYPAVPMRSARLRFFLTSEHSSDQIERALRATREEIDRLENESFGLKAAAVAARMVAG
jgi:8-amino-7-oxononanoate synthase